MSKVARRQSLSDPSAGLAISYDADYFKQPHALTVVASDLAWLTKEKENEGYQTFKPSYDPIANISPRTESSASEADSVLDAYANLYDEYDEEVDESFDTSVSEDDETASHAAPQPRQPWDTRGKNGLYGGGGRGADDVETGWVKGYGIEEDLQHTNIAVPPQRFQPEHHRDSSVSTEDSANAPITPIFFTLESVKSVPPQNSSPPDENLSPRSVQNVSAAAGEPSSALGERKFTPLVRTMPRPRAANVKHVLATIPQSPASPAEMSQSPHLQALSKLESPIPSLTPPPALPIATPSRALPQVSVRKPTNISASGGAPKKSSSFTDQIAKLTGRQKKKPAISLPILPEGFVEALGMETFALTPEILAGANSARARRGKGTPISSSLTSGPSLSRKTASPSKQEKTKITVTGKPTLVRTPLDALREAGAVTPVDSGHSSRTSDRDSYASSNGKRSATSARDQAVSHSRSHSQPQLSSVQVERSVSTQSHSTSTASAYQPSRAASERRGSRATAGTTRADHADMSTAGSCVPRRKDSQSSLLEFRGSDAGIRYMQGDASRIMPSSKAQVMSDHSRASPLYQQPIRRSSEDDRGSRGGYLAPSYGHRPSLPKTVSGLSSHVDSYIEGRDAHHDVGTPSEHSLFSLDDAEATPALSDVSAYSEASASPSPEDARGRNSLHSSLNAPTAQASKFGQPFQQSFGRFQEKQSFVPNSDLYSPLSFPVSPQGAFEPFGSRLGNRDSAVDPMTRRPEADTSRLAMASPSRSEFNLDDQHLFRNPFQSSVATSVSSKPVKFGWQ